jgi:hypothetical protein
MVDIILHLCYNRHIKQYGELEVVTKAPKEFTVETTRISLRSDDKVSYVTNTLKGLIEHFKYDLEWGASWSSNKAMKKVNTNPKSIGGLVTALNNAAYNISISCRGNYYHQVYTNSTMVDSDK